MEGLEEIDAHRIDVRDVVLTSGGRVTVNNEAAVPAASADWGEHRYTGGHDARQRFQFRRDPYLHRLHSRASVAQLRGIGGKQNHAMPLKSGIERVHVDQGPAKQARADE